MLTSDWAELYISPAWDDIQKDDIISDIFAEVLPRVE